MSKYSWDDPNLQRVCGHCHFRDNDPDLCHALEPPVEKKNIPSHGRNCAWLPDSYWDRLSDERKKEFNDLVELMSKEVYGASKQSKKQ